MKDIEEEKRRREEVIESLSEYFDYIEVFMTRVKANGDAVEIGGHGEWAVYEDQALIA